MSDIFNTAKPMFEAYHHRLQKRLTLCDKHVREAQETHGRYLTVNATHEKDAVCMVCPIHRK